MLVAPSPLFSRRGDPHIKNFRVGSEIGGVGCVSLCLCAFFALDLHDFAPNFMWNKIKISYSCMHYICLG